MRISEAKLLFHSKFIYPDGAIREMVIWHMPKPEYLFQPGNSPEKTGLPNIILWRIKNAAPLLLSEIFIQNNH